MRQKYNLKLHRPVESVSLRSQIQHQHSDRTCIGANQEIRYGHEDEKSNRKHETFIKNKLSATHINLRS